MSDALLLSGGLDSIAAWRLLGCPQGVFVEHGQKALPQEQRAIVWAARQAGWWGYEGAQIRGILIPPLTVQENGYVPYRNAIFVMLAANYTGCDRVIVAQVAEWAPDKNLRFWKQLGDLMNQMTRSKVNEIDRKVEIVAPFANLTKGQLLARYAEQFGWGDLGDLLSNTWSCYRMGSWHCGECAGCLHRAQAEISLDMLGSTEYSRPLDQMTVADYYRMRAATAGARDGIRWVRGNGIRSLVARAKDAR